MPADLGTFQKITIPKSNLISSDGFEEIYEWETVGNYYSEAREMGAMAIKKNEETNDWYLYISGGMSLQGYSWKNTQTWNTGLHVQNVKNFKYNLTQNNYEDLSASVMLRTIGSAGGIFGNYFYVIGGAYIGSGNASYPYRGYIYVNTNIYKVDITNGSATTVGTVPSYFMKPAYVQKDNLLYIIGGSPITRLTQATEGVYIFGDNIIDVINSDNRKVYVYDMELESFTSLPDLPITGGKYVSACISGDYIYIRNLQSFCRYNIITKEYEMLPSFKLFENVDDTPEIINYTLDGVEVILSTSGSLEFGYAQCYNITTNEITDWNFSAYPTQRFKLFNIDNTLYQVYGSVGVPEYHGVVVTKMVKKQTELLSEQPIVAKIPSGSYYHGLETLQLPELGITITTTPKLADKDYYIKRGMYSYPSEYTLYLESK